MNAPAPSPDWALFLDLDGTLIDFADAPDAVTVPPGLPPVLQSLARSLDGALAIVTGRPLADIDRLFRPMRLPCGCEHGAVMRYHAADAPQDAHAAVPDGWFARAGQAVLARPGTLLERKSHGLVLHYRRAPEAAAALKALAEDFVAEKPEAFELLESAMAWEIRPRGITKGRAVECFMAEPPFRGRVPVFIGDDVTDRDGCRAAAALGGHGLMVPDVFPGGPAEVRRWLADAAEKLAG